MGHVRHRWEEDRDSHGQSGILQMERTGWRFCDKRSKNCLEEKTTESRRILAGLERNLNKDCGGKKYGKKGQDYDRSK